MSAQQTWVIKIGTSVITGEGAGLMPDILRNLSDQIGALVQRGISVLLVSSGAVGIGMERAGTTQRPKSLDWLQALAALGQADLVARWQTELGRHNLQAALVLLTQHEIEDRQRYLNVRNTLLRLQQMQVIPVINENDSVSTAQLQFGDNDNLAGLVVDLVDADRLVILTDRDGMYDGGDPVLNPDSKLIDSAEVSDASLDAAAMPNTGELGRGGMHSKLQAARKAALAGTDTYIINGRTPNVLLQLLDGKPTGTLLKCSNTPSSARRRWLAGRQAIAGTLHLDAGAVQALVQKGASLLPIGVARVEGNFEKGDLVRCVGPDGDECAIGLTNYDSRAAAQIAGHHSGDIAKLLNEPFAEEVIHRDNMHVSTGRPA